MVGLEVLIAGIAMGWGVGGWAAYANIFFLVVGLRILRNGGSVGVLCAAMVLLAVATPLFDGPILSEATMDSTSVASWGWGALIWGLSICLLAAAAWLQRSKSKPTGTYLFAGAVGTIAVVAAVVFVRNGQWQKANDQERELYLPVSMAFTTIDFCGLAFNWPAAALVAAGDPIVLEVDERLDSKGAPEMLVHLPELAEPIVRGYRWTSHKKISPFMPEIRVGHEATSEGAFVLRVAETTGGAAIRIVNPQGIQVFEQLLRRRASPKKYDQYCPYSGFVNPAVPYRGYLDALVNALQPALAITRAFDRKSMAGSEEERTLLKTQVAGACVSSGEVGGLRGGVQTLDGRSVMVLPDSRSLASFCSEDYVALAFVRSSMPESAVNLNAGVFVYDRSSLRPLAEFRDRSGCLISNSCVQGVLPQQIEGLVIADDWVRVRTQFGESRVKRMSNR